MYNVVKMIDLLPVSPRVDTLTKTWALKLPPPGQPGRLMEGTGTGWNNAFLPRATSNQGNSPLSGEKKAAWTPHTLKEA